MTVEELIEKLQKFPPEMEVRAFSTKPRELPVLEVCFEEGFEDSDDVVLLEVDI
tara:strand:+ start:343 stop:504 length:162 start_codon:yes stop_codon:yes gene_type:complete